MHARKIAWNVMESRTREPIRPTKTKIKIFIPFFFFFLNEHWNGGGSSDEQAALFHQTEFSSKMLLFSFIGSFTRYSKHIGPSEEVAIYIVCVLVGKLKWELH